MKKIIQFIVITGLLLITASFVSAAEGVNVSIDGVRVEFSAVSGMPFIDENSRTQVPFRQTLEAFGATVEWDDEARAAVASKDGITVRVPIGTDCVYKNDVKIVNDTKSMIKDDRTYLPIRIVLEAFGADVSYDAETRTVMVKSDGETVSLVILAAEVEAAMKNIKSANAAVISTLSMEAGGERTDTELVHKMNIFYDPIRIKTEIGTTIDNEKTDTELYIIQNGKTVTAYLNSASTGFTEVADMDIANYNDPLKNTRVTALLPKFAVTGAETVNGVSAIKIQGTISKETLDGLFALQDLKDVLESVLGEGTIVLPPVDIPMTVWVDPDTKTIMKFVIDMTDIYNAALRSLSETTAATTGLKIINYTSELTVSNINNATEFTIQFIFNI